MTSVAGRQGVVVLVKGDVGLSSVDNTADADKPVSTAQATANTADRMRANHTGTQLAVTISDFAAAADARISADVTVKQPLDADLTAIAALAPPNDSVLQRKGSVWVASTPATIKADLLLVKADVGLSNVDNTADVDKPVSTAQAAANTSDRARANHTGTQLAVTVSDFSAAVDARIGADSTVKQPLDSDLTAIAALAPANDTVLQRKGDVWVASTPATVKTDLVLVKADVGLSNVDNTSDTNKPVSTAQSAADALRVLKTGDTMTGLLTVTSGGAIGVQLNGGVLRTLDATLRYRNDIQVNSSGLSFIPWDNTGGVGMPITLNGISVLVNSSLQTTGTLTFGSAGDTNLYRSAADTLKTDDSLIVAGNLTVTGTTTGTFVDASKLPLAGGTMTGQLDVNVNTGIKVRAGTSGFTLQENNTNIWQFAPVTATAAALRVVSADFVIASDGVFKLLFGSTSDTNLYRSAADQLKTDDAFVVAGISYSLAENRSQVATSGDVAYGVLSAGAGVRQLAIMGDGSMRWSSGAAAYDTTLYRSAVGTLTTDGQLTAGGSLISTGGTVTASSTNVGNFVANQAVASGGSAGLYLQVATVSKWSLYMAGANDQHLYLRDVANSRMMVTFTPGAPGSMVVDGSLQTTGAITAGGVLLTGGATLAANTGAALYLTTNGIAGSNAAPLYPLLEFRGYANAAKARIRASEQTADTNGSILSFWANDNVGTGGTITERIRMSYTGAALTPNPAPGGVEILTSLAVDGTVYFGTAADTNLYRSAADTLKTDDTLIVAGTVLALDHASAPRLQLMVAGTERAYITTTSGGITRFDSDASLTFATNNLVALVISTTGVLQLGTASDTNLYRLSANALKTDGSLTVVGAMGVNGATAGAVAKFEVATTGGDGVKITSTAQNNWPLNISSINATTSNGIYLDIRGQADSNYAILVRNNATDLFRVTSLSGNVYALGTITTPSTVSAATVATANLTATSDIRVTRAAANSAYLTYVGTDSAHSFRIDTGGLHQWGPGGAAAIDTNLYRASAASLRTDGEMVANTFWAMTGITAYGTVTVNDSFSMRGSQFVMAPVAKTVDTTLAFATDRYAVANKTTGIMTLPAASSCTGALIAVKNINISSCQVKAVSGTIDGAAASVGIALAQWAVKTFLSDGTNWLTV